MFLYIHTQYIVTSMVYHAVREAPTYRTVVTSLPTNSHLGVEKQLLSPLRNY